LCFVANQPDWSLFRDSKIQNFPSVKWKLMNQEKMKKDKIIQYVEATNAALYK